MSTERLYQKDVYMKECEAKVISISKEEDKTKVILDRTVFFPTGGGQSCDLGVIADMKVTDVFEEGEDVVHVVERISGKPEIKEGEEVHCSIDWERRFDNMQRHCGEHIMSGMFYREYGGVNRGFHMGDDYMTIDISLEEDPAYDKLTWEMAMHVQDCTNEAIWANLPVTVRRFETREEAANLPLRKKLAIDEDISIVCVGDESNPADCVACCGTHPSTSSQVGLVKILKVEKNKGMFRVYLEAGKRAMEKYNQQYELISKLGNKYSAGVEDLPEKMAAQEERNREVREELHVLRQSVIADRAEKIKNDLESAGEDEILTYEYADMKTNDLMNIAKNLNDSIKKLLLIISPSDNTLLLFSNGEKVDCGKLVKENASIYNGKGGGNKTAARALFPNRDYLDTFIDLVEKHLRNS